MGRPHSTAVLPHVAIVGAGFGGLEAARRLALAPVEITLIDRHNYHLFQPLLYQVATAALSPADIAAPIRHILRDQKNAVMLLDEVTGVDLAARCIVLRHAGSMHFDYLVLATGSVYSYFGHADWPRFAPGLKSIDDATYIRRRVLLAFEKAETTADAAARQRLMTFVLVGAGPTGVELAGALAELARAALADDFRRINPRSARILLIEAGPRVLAGFADRLSRFAERTLDRMGVELLLNTPIRAVDARGVTAKGEHIEAATVIWCAGVEATPVAPWLGLAPEKGGRVAVAPDLSVPGHPEVFVIGDAAYLVDARGKPLPGVATVAQQEGRYVAELIRCRATGATPPPPFRYHDKGALATIGRSAAVADLPWLKLTGWLAWVLWGCVHIYGLIGFRNRMAVFLDWVWAWLTYARGARLITGDDPPPASKRTTAPTDQR
jgi:NADH:ubiquinone reductase (H+-translocating)